MELESRLKDIVEAAELKKVLGSCSAHADFLGCAKALLIINEILSTQMKDEEAHWHKLGVAWPSALSKEYRANKKILEIINTELAHATEKGIIEENNQQEHQEGDESGQATEASSGDCVQQSRQEEIVGGTISREPITEPGELLHAESAVTQAPPDASAQLPVATGPIEIHDKEPKRGWFGR